MLKRIVYTRQDGGVSICAPSLTALAFMTGGGGRWDPPPRMRWERWDGKSYLVPVPNRFLHVEFGVPTWFLDAQIAKQAEECGEWAAARFVRAMQFGGLSTAEAYGIMRDRFCAHLGTGCELWDVEDVPTDRTYRNAWRRSPNGGPILLDERKVMEIEERRAWRAYEAGNPGWALR